GESEQSLLPNRGRPSGVPRRPKSFCALFGLTPTLNHDKEKIVSFKNSAYETDPSQFTRAIRGGSNPDPATGALISPIYQSTTFLQEAVGRHKGFTYSRAANPSVDQLERALGALEDTPPAVCFSTGMSAITTLLLTLLQSGDHVVVSDVIYGGTVRLLRQILSKLGIAASFVDTSDQSAI